MTWGTEVFGYLVVNLEMRISPSSDGWSLTVQKHILLLQRFPSCRQRLYAQRRGLSMHTESTSIISVDRKHFALRSSVQHLNNPTNIHIFSTGQHIRNLFSHLCLRSADCLCKSLTWVLRNLCCRKSFVRAHRHQLVLGCTVSRRLSPFWLSSGVRCKKYYGS